MSYIGSRLGWTARMRPYVFHRYVFGWHRLCCNEEKTPETMISRDVIFDELASWADERREGAIAEPDCDSMNKKVENDDAKQSSLIASEWQ